MHYITEQDVRDYIWDRTVADNAIELDLTFSPEEIAKASVSCVREYNSIPPFVGSLSNPKQIPGDTNIFLDGIVYFLYSARLQQLMRGDIDYNAGGVTTNLVQKQIEHLKNNVKEYQSRFVRGVKDFKIARNIRSAYGTF